MQKVTWCAGSEVFIVEMTSVLSKIEKKITYLRWKKLFLRDAACEGLQLTELLISSKSMMPEGSKDP